MASLLSSSSLLWRHSFPFRGQLLNLSRGLRTPGYRDERVTTTSDGAVIVCWHPETKFPYELTRPVPRGKGIVETDSKSVMCSFLFATTINN